MAQEIKKSDQGPAPAQRYSDPFSAMRAEMDRVFDSFLGRGLGRFPLPARRDATTDVMPSIDVHETDKEIMVEAELPGMEEKDVKLSLRDGILSIEGEKKSEREEKQADYHLSERSYGRFQRAFQVPESVDESKVTAAFDKGVLKVTMPKKPEASKAAREIPIGKSG